MSQPSFESASFDSAANNPGTHATAAGSSSNYTAVKESLNVYTVMLLVSFLALLIGAILLLIELRRWGAFPAEAPWDTSTVGGSVSQLEFDASPSALSPNSQQLA